MRTRFLTAAVALVIGSAAWAQRPGAVSRRAEPEAKEAIQTKALEVVRGLTDRNKVWVIEGKNGVQLRFDRASAEARTLKARSLPGGRVRIEWDDDLAIEGRRFEMRPLDEPPKDDVRRTIIEGAPDGFVRLTMEDGAPSGERQTCRGKSISLHFETMEVEVR